MNTTSVIISVLSMIGLMCGSGGLLTLLIKNRPSKTIRESDQLTNTKKDHEDDREAWRREKEEWRKEREAWRQERTAFSIERSTWATERVQWEQERDRMEERHAIEVLSLQNRVTELENELRKKDN